MVNNMKGTGIILPIKLRMKEYMGDSPSDMPTGIAPLSSITGNALSALQLILLIRS